MSKIPVISEHIEITLGVCGGKPRIAGQRITVQDIVIWHERMGLSPDEIVYLNQKKRYLVVQDATRSLLNSRGTLMHPGATSVFHLD